MCVCIRPERTKRNVRAAAAAPEEAPHACARFGRVESRRPAEKGASKAPSTTLVRQGARGFLHEIRCTRRNSGTLRVRPVPNPTPPPAPPFHQRKSGIEREEKKKTGASGVNRHSDKHAPRSIPEAQDAFKVLMIHWILQVARRIAFRCVLHRCGSQDIRR